MNEIIRLRKENAELRAKLDLAVDIVNEFIENSRRPDIIIEKSNNKNEWNSAKKLNAVM